MKTKTLSGLGLFINNLEEELDNAVRGVFGNLPIKVPRQIELEGIWIPVINIIEIGVADNQYILQRPIIKLDIDIRR